MPASLKWGQFIGTPTLSLPTTTAAVVSAGSFLTLHYRLAGPAGDIINTFADKPATLSLGTGELSPAMEQRLIGLAEGTHATFELAAGEAFGERNAEMQQWVAKTLLARMGDPDEKYAVGDVVQFPTPDGTGSYAGAKTARLGQQDLLQARDGVRRTHSTPTSCTSKVTGWPASGWLKSKRTALSLASITAPA